MDRYLKPVHKNYRPTESVKPKWRNIEIPECLLAKRDARNRLKSFTNNEERISFVELRRKTKRLIKHSKRSTELHVANQSKTNPKEFYSFVRQKRVITSAIGPIIDVNGDYTNDEEQISNILNTFFASVFTV